MLYPIDIIIVYLFFFLVRAPSTPPSLLPAAIFRAWAIAGECCLFTILRMAFRTPTKDSLVPGTSPACTQGRTWGRALVGGIFVQRNLRFSNCIKLTRTTKNKQQQQNQSKADVVHPAIPGEILSKRLFYNQYFLLRSSCYHTLTLLGQFTDHTSPALPWQGDRYRQ